MYEMRSEKLRNSVGDQTIFFIISQCNAKNKSRRVKISHPINVAVVWMEREKVKCTAENAGLRIHRLLFSELSALFLYLNSHRLEQCCGCFAFHIVFCVFLWEKYKELKFIQEKEKKNILFIR
jgi:hypothetical protein